MEFNSHEIRVSEHSLSVGKVNEDCVMKSFGRNENSHQHCVSLEELLPISIGEADTLEETNCYGFSLNTTSLKPL